MLAVVIVIVLAAVIVFGLLIFWLMRRTQQEVPHVADARDARYPQVVGTDEQGKAITDAEEPPAPARDGGAFEDLLQDEISDRGMEQPPADDEP